MQHREDIVGNHDPRAAIYEANSDGIRNVHDNPDMPLQEGNETLRYDNKFKCGHLQ